MCFSPVASFGLGSILIPIGVCASILAYKKNPRFLLLALIPIMFGVQQCAEGFVWLQLYAEHRSGAYFFAYIYLFFAFAFWPAYIPYSVYFIEKDVMVKKIIFFFMIMGPLLAALLYGPILLGFVKFKVAIVEHAIFYDVYQSEKLMWTYTIFYAMAVLFPLLFSSALRVKIYGFLSLVSLMISYWWYFYEFTSVWCFFCAILSFYIFYIVYKLRAIK